MGGIERDSSEVRRCDRRSLSRAGFLLGACKMFKRKSWRFLGSFLKVCSRSSLGFFPKICSMVEGSLVTR